MGIIRDALKSWIEGLKDSSSQKPGEVDVLRSCALNVFPGSMVVPPLSIDNELCGNPDVARRFDERPK